MANYATSNQPPASKHGEYRAPRRRGSLSGLVTFLIVIVAIIFVMSVLFRVSDIRVEGNEHYTDQEIIDAIGVEQGDNLFFFDRIAAGSRVFAKLPYVEDVSVERQLPNRVTIRVEECKALAYLSIGDEEWTIDHSCKILGKAAEGETGELIPIYGIDPGTLMIGEKLEVADGDESLVDSLAEVLYQLQERGLDIGTGRINISESKVMSFTYGGKYTVILGPGTQIEHKFAMFVSVLQQLKEGDVGTIDLSNADNARFIPS